MALESGHYIGVGAKDCFYTLRYWFEEQIKVGPAERGETRKIVRDYHVRNLTTVSLAEAERIASEIVGRPVRGSEAQLQEICRRKDIDWSILQGGKYAGQSIHEIAETDPAYLLFLAENCRHSRSYEKTVELIEALSAFRAYVDPILEAREVEKAEANRQEAHRQGLLTPIADLIDDGRDEGFCASIAASMRRGEMPRGRGESLALEIAAKRKSGSRKGTDRYKAAYTEIERIFEAAKNA